MRHARLQKLQRFRRKMPFYSFLILCRVHYAKMQTPWRLHIAARSNSNDGRCEAYLWFNISYLHKKNTTLNGNKISFNLAYYL